MERLAQSLRAFIQISLALFIGTLALVFPYKLRCLYIKFIAELFHLPFFIFGKLTKYLCDQLNIDLRKIYEE